MKARISIRRKGSPDASPGSPPAVEAPEPVQGASIPSVGHSFADVAIFPSTPEPAPEAARAQGGLPADVQAKMERSFGADFSGVRIHPASPDAARLDALAYARGEEIHFAPHRFQPHSLTGQELIGHELAHVVQQREGRVAPTIQAAPDVWVNQSPALESEADARGRQAARGLPAGAPAPAAGAAPRRPVIQGVFTASSSITPATPEELGTQDGSDNKTPAMTENAYAAGSLKVNGVQMPGGIRPPTKLKGSQGRHTVAWAARVLEWSKVFTGPIPTVLQEIHARAQDDQEFSDSGHYSGILAQVRELQAKDKQLPVSDWITKIEGLISDYVATYQSAAFAVFSSTNPKGHGEADRLANLKSWSETLKNGPDPEIKDAAIPGRNKALLDNAFGLLDTHPSMGNEQRYKVFKDWLSMVQVLYPGIFLAPQDKADRVGLRVPNVASVEKIRTDGLTQQKIVLDEMLAASKAKTDVEGAEDKTVDVEEATGDAEEAKMEAEEAEEEEKEEEKNRRIDTLFNTRSFAVSVDVAPNEQMNGGNGGATGAPQTFPAAALRVRRLDASNERARTQFGRKQGNHVIPWVLERAVWSREFVGKPLDVVLAEIRRRTQQHGGTLQEPPQTAAIGAWTTFLDRGFEEYVRAYQAAKSSTYGVEAGPDGKAVPAGHGEAPALAYLKNIEDALNDKDAKPEINESTLKGHFGALIDVPQLHQTRAKVGLEKPGDLETLKTEWKRRLTVLFPMTCKRFDKLLDGVFVTKSTPTGYYLVQNEKHYVEEQVRLLQETKREFENLKESKWNQPGMKRRLSTRQSNNQTKDYSDVKRRKTTHSTEDEDTRERKQRLEKLEKQIKENLKIAGILDGYSTLNVKGSDKAIQQAIKLKRGREEGQNEGPERKKRKLGPSEDQNVTMDDTERVERAKPRIPPTRRKVASRGRGGRNRQ